MHCCSDPGPRLPPTGASNISQTCPRATQPLGAAWISIISIANPWHIAPALIKYYLHVFQRNTACTMCSMANAPPRGDLAPDEVAGREAPQTPNDRRLGKSTLDPKW
eukprot:8774700-Pyramimonas_sp.AAC.1